jgi:hypothetical protein
MNDAFHAHLDGCKRCRTHPFGLCAIGQDLIQKIAVTMAAGMGETGPEHSKTYCGDDSGPLPDNDDDVKRPEDHD